MERTLIILKPDAVQRRLIGRIIARFEHRGLRIVAMKMVALSEGEACRLYAVHEGKDFYEPLIRFVTSSPMVAMVVDAPHAIRVAREMLGPTDSTHAPPGTVRGDFGLSQRYNLVHASDSAESFERECAVFFSPDEFLEYDLHDRLWFGL
jgi:nucleoside-diphosphate kinase